MSMHTIVYPALQRLATLCFDAPNGEKNFNWDTCTYDAPTPRSYRDLIIVASLAAALVALGLWQYRQTKKKRSQLHSKQRPPKA